MRLERTSLSDNPVHTLDSKENLMKKSFISLAAFSAAGALLALSGCVVNDSSLR